MVKEIIKDKELLSKLCKTAYKGEELNQLIQDLKDSAKYYEKNAKDGCVGLAANQIGSDLRVIICKIGNNWKVMINPIIMKKSNTTRLSTEGCLSVEGHHTVKRYDGILVRYINENRKCVSEYYAGFNAIIIQHETDHLIGKLIG